MTWGKREGHPYNRGDEAGAKVIELMKEMQLHFHSQFCKEFTVLMNYSNSSLPYNDNTLTCILPELLSWRGRDGMRAREPGIAHKFDSCVKIWQCLWGDSCR